ncbi:hypothetical protein SLS61_003208 [Didymella pomorum]
MSPGGGCRESAAGETMKTPAVKTEPSEKAGNRGAPNAEKWHPIKQEIVKEEPCIKIEPDIKIEED